MSKVYVINGRSVTQVPRGNCHNCAFIKDAKSCDSNAQRAAGSRRCYSGDGHNYALVKETATASVGHHPVHSGLQNHSVGGAYPLCIVGYGNGDATQWVIENLATNEVMCSDARGTRTSAPYQWGTYNAANLRIDAVVAGRIEDAIWVKGRPKFSKMGYLEM